MGVAVSDDDLRTKLLARVEELGYYDARMMEAAVRSELERRAFAALVRGLTDEDLIWLGGLLHRDLTRRIGEQRGDVSPVPDGDSTLIPEAKRKMALIWRRMWRLRGSD